MKAQIQKGYFRNNRRFGRTTKLLIDGVAVIEVMGIASKRDLIKQHANTLKRN